MGIRLVYFVGDSGRARRPWRAAGYWKNAIGVSAKHRVGQRRPRRAAGYWIMAIIEIEIAIAIDRINPKNRWDDPAFVTNRSGIPITAAKLPPNGQPAPRSA
jgi:hypothetical protein